MVGWAPALNMPSTVAAIVESNCLNAVNKNKKDYYASVGKDFRTMTIH